MTGVSFASVNGDELASYPTVAGKNRDRSLAPRPIPDGQLRREQGARTQPTLPEASNFNFAPYIRAPKLVVNGRQDEEHPWFTRALPLWNLLREPKELVLIDGAGHHPPVEMRVPPINSFLDRTLGPVVSATAK